MATIYDIGKALGVSPMTVSNALNHRKGVGAATAKRIREYAKKIGYRPSHIARMLSKGSTGTIGLCLRNSPCNPWIAGVLDELNQRVCAAGYALNVMMSDGGLEQISAALQQLDEQRVEATIIGPLGYMQEYVELAENLRPLPNVVAFDAVDYLPVDHCMVDVYHGGLLAMQHLIELGHKNIGYIGASVLDVRIEGVRNRYAAYRDSLENHGLPLDPQWLCVYSQSELQNIEASEEQFTPILEQLLREGKMPTAWFCHDDWIAAQIICGLNRIGLSVPGDVSVIGYDNQPVCRVTNPAITSVGSDLRQYVNSIVQMMLKRLSQKKAAGEDMEAVDVTATQRVMLEPKIFVRQSTGPVKSLSSR